MEIVNLVEQHQSYKKALRVINSCKNKTHIKGARNYINNFFQTYSERDTSFFDLRVPNVFLIDSEPANMYSDLMIELSKKEVLLEV